MPADRSISSEDRAEIIRRLYDIEANEAVKIVLACESGSRAWGFASPDSDYDVRFLYVSRPEWYLSVDLEERRDVIETPIEGVWDINGWDLRKALRLFRKSNPPLLEWLQSPIVYCEESSAASRMRALLPEFYSDIASMYHYLHMSQKNFRTYLHEPEVWTKKYFYVLRPLLACRWVESGKGAVPMEFERLVEAGDLPPEVNRAIQELLLEKRAGAELRRGPRVEVLHKFIQVEFLRHEEAGVVRQPPRREVAPLSELFQAVLNEIWALPSSAA